MPAAPSGGSVLGFTAYGHTSAAALLVDGRLVAAAEEERFTRQKYTGAPPLESIRFCLAEAGVRPEELAAIGFFFDLKLGLPHYILHMARYFPGTMRLVTEREVGPEGYELLIHPLRTLGLRSRLVRAIGAPPGTRVPFHFLEHHRCHAAHFLASPFDEAAILTVDAFGEWTSTGLFHGRGERIEALGRVTFPHSLGALYNAVAKHLGFGTLEGPGKVMGLAAYGDPARFGAQVSRLVRLLPDGTFVLELDYFEFHRRRRRRSSTHFEEIFGPPRAPGAPLTDRDRDLAAAIQATTEDAILHLARSLRKRTGCRDLVLAGGVALNSQANGRLAAAGIFDRVFVPPAPGDPGTAVGAGCLVHMARGGRRSDLVPESPYLGPAYSEAACRQAARDRGLTARRHRDLVPRVADLLARGALVGWFQGRMEFGPRALGHRSLLCDPGDPAAKERMNERVKGREGFRPYAPSCPAERADEFFELAGPSPFMSFVSAVRPSRRDQIPAVVHTDGSARVQTVRCADNPRFHALLEAFGARSGYPVLLDTSFNRAGEPIVCRPAEAVATFLETRLDALVLGDLLLVKPRARSGR